MEAENEAILVEVENRIWYNLLKDYGLRHSSFRIREMYIMARKSRKHPELAVPFGKDTVAISGCLFLTEIPTGL